LGKEESREGRGEGIPQYFLLNVGIIANHSLKIIGGNKIRKNSKKECLLTNLFPFI
jgi:hypothetical protein